MRKARLEEISIGAIQRKLGFDAFFGRTDADDAHSAVSRASCGQEPTAKPWHLTPVVASGTGVTHGYLHSPSTKRLGLVTLTDVAPTVLDSLGKSVPPSKYSPAMELHPMLGAHVEDKDQHFLVDWKS